MRRLFLAGAALLCLLLCAAKPKAPPTTLPFSETHPIRWILAGNEARTLMIFRAAYGEIHAAAQADVDAVVASSKAVADDLHIRPFWFEEVDGSEDVRALSIRYGVPMSYLESLNPGVDFSAIEEASRVMIYRADPTLPARSVGTASKGHFVEGMPMLDDDAWVVRDPARAWAMPHTVRRLVAGMRHVAQRYPGASIMMIGDMSRYGGGRMRPHRSHQSGRDADVTYYSLGGAQPKNQFWDARSADFDVARTWALFRYWLQRDWAEFIFADRSVQKMLADYAYNVGEDPAFVQRVFEIEGGGMRSIIRHAPGHANHFHVRFRCLDDDEECK